MLVLRSLLGATHTHTHDRCAGILPSVGPTSRGRPVSACLSGMARPTPVADRDWVTLRTRGNSQWLEHHGAGERWEIKLEDGDRSQAYELSFTSSEEASLMHAHKPPLLASRLFSQGFFHSTDAGSGERGFLIASHSESTWRSDKLGRFRTLCFQHSAGELDSKFT